MKKAHLFLLVFLFGFIALTATPVMAEHGGDKQCMMGKDCKKCEEGKDSSGCPIAGKIMKKAKFFLKNAKEIGLSDDQVAQIKAIKLDTKKTSIRTEAEMKIGMMDMEAKLSEPKVDVEGLNAMIDQGMAGMATGAKASVATYAKLKAVLTEAQMTKAKEIWTRDSDEKTDSDGTHDSHGK